MDKAQDKLDKLQKKMKREKNQETKLEYKKEIDRIQIEAEPIEEQLGLFDTLQEFVFTRSLKSICFLFERTSMVIKLNYYLLLNFYTNYLLNRHFLIIL